MTVKRNKKIVVVPLAGLGNRMRVLSSSIAIAKRDNRTLYVAWPINSDLGCDITDIFESIGIDYIVPPRWKHYVLTKFYQFGAIRRYYKFYKVISNVFFSSSVFDNDIIDAKVVNKLKSVKINSNDASLLVATCLSFRSDEKIMNFIDYLYNDINRALYQKFRFTKNIRSKVDYEYQQINQQYIGIHIRRLDHTDISEHSPDQNYFNEIDKCLYENPDQKFFLATDDEMTKYFFLKKYNGSIYTLQKKIGRSDVEGISVGVTELLLLSKSNKIICSIISSYSNAAILIGGVKKVVYVDDFIDK